MLIGGFERWGWLMLLASLGVLVSAAYAIRTLGQLFAGPPRPELADLQDLRPSEWLAALPLAAGLLILGLQPASVIALMNVTIAQLSAIFYPELTKEPAMSATVAPDRPALGPRQIVEQAIAHLDHVLPGQAPILNFVHHNTLHGYQHLPFEQALAAAEQLTGIRAYLPEENFRALYRAGRIGDADLDAAFARREALDTEAVLLVRAGDRDIRRGEVLRGALVHGVEALPLSQLIWRIEELTSPGAFSPMCRRPCVSDCWRRPNARASSGSPRAGKSVARLPARLATARFRPAPGRTGRFANQPGEVAAGAVQGRWRD